MEEEEGALHQSQDKGLFLSGARWQLSRQARIWGPGVVPFRQSQTPCTTPKGTFSSSNKQGAC